MGYSPFTAQDKYEIAIERGYIVDPEDEWLLYEYTWSSKGKEHPYAYTSRVIDGQRFFMMLHHMIVGSPINDYVVDHIDRNPKNNKRSNLRIVSQGTNLRNQGRNLYEDNYVHHLPDRLRPYRVLIPIGHYHTQEEAIDVRNAVVKLLNDAGYL